MVGHLDYMFTFLQIAIDSQRHSRWVIRQRHRRQTRILAIIVDKFVCDSLYMRHCAMHTFILISSLLYTRCTHITSQICCQTLLYYSQSHTLMIVDHHCYAFDGKKYFFSQELFVNNSYILISLQTQFKILRLRWWRLFCCCYHCVHTCLEQNRLDWIFKILLNSINNNNSGKMYPTNKEFAFDNNE